MGIALIINPVAGGVNKGVIQKAQKRFGNNVTTYYTSLKDGKFDIPGFDSNDFEKTGIIGGDGTLNDTVNFLLKQGNNEVEKIGFIPRGTGNGYLRALGNSKSLTKSIETVLEGEARPVDVIHMAQPIDVYSLNFLDIGAIARILEKRNQIGEKAKRYLKLNSTGIIGYAVAILQVTKDLPKLYLEEGFIDEKRITPLYVSDEKRIPSPQVYEDIVIGKGYTPNHFPIMGVLPAGKLDDGMLRVAFYEKADTKVAMKMLFHRKSDRKEYSGRRIALAISGESPIQADGNTISYFNRNVTTFHITSEPNKIEMIFKK